MGQMHNEQQRVWLAQKEYDNLTVSRKPVTLQDDTRSRLCLSSK